MRKKWSTLSLAAAALVACAATAGAQETKKDKDATRVEQKVIVRQGEPFKFDFKFEPFKADTFVFVTTEMSFNGTVVKGAPYSAEAVTESVQTFADGNRIIRKNTAQVYRDGEGRTRREQTINILGPYRPAGDAPQTVLINDPVAGVNYALDPRNKTARKLNVLRFFDRPLGTAGQKSQAETDAQKRVLEQGYVYTTPGAHGVGSTSVQFYSGKTDDKNTKTESLGKQFVEGVEAEGTRTTTTIPAGEIGNEQPIEIVRERWYSPELQVVVKTVSSDPRTGTTTYRLSNISRTEPSPTLFQVPSDYTIRETPAPRVRTFTRRNGQNKEFQYQYQ